MPRVATAWRASHGRSPDAAAITSIFDGLRRPLFAEAKRCATLVPGAVETVARLRGAGLQIGSSTGYPRSMMRSILRLAASQGYAPDHLVCAGETPEGRPSPLMIYKACADLGVWPLSRVVKVDDAEAGVAEGRNAGCLTIGVAASGNGVGLTQEALMALPAAERAERVAASGARLRAAGADLVIDSVADLVPALEAIAAKAP